MGRLHEPGTLNGTVGKTTMGKSHDTAGVPGVPGQRRNGHEPGGTVPGGREQAGGGLPRTRPRI